MKIVRIKPSNSDLLASSEGNNGIIPTVGKGIIKDAVTKKFSKPGFKIDTASTMVTIAGAGLAVQIIGLLFNVFKKPEKSTSNGKS